MPTLMLVRIIVRGVQVAQRELTVNDLGLPGRPYTQWVIQQIEAKFPDLADDEIVRSYWDDNRDFDVEYWGRIKSEKTLTS